VTFAGEKPRFRPAPDPADVGVQMYSLIRELYPVTRSISGDGVRETLRQIATHIPLKIHEVPTGTQVFDWMVPNEWNIRDAYVKNADGHKVVDFTRSNLHVVNYSIPINVRMPLAELRGHLHTLPEHPDWIPYKTSYYQERWGFCLTQNQLDRLPEGIYEAVIDASLTEGYLTYGEYYLPGTSSDEVLVSCHVCHPSLCNDNLSGISLSTFLAKQVSAQAHRYSYRFLFVPGTIGPITWLALNEHATTRIKHGLVVSNVGDAGNMTYKKSRRGDAEIDRVVEYVLRSSGNPYELRDFSPCGYDERQYCSPGFDLPVGSLTRTPSGHYPEYHTSADDLNFVRPEHLEYSFNTYLAVIDTLERNKHYVNQNPKCEPQLGKRGLYHTMGGNVGRNEAELAMLWVLNLSDGRHSVLDIAERSALRFCAVHAAALELEAAGLLLTPASAGTDR
jgi:aminopeptidase-like protein